MGNSYEGDFYAWANEQAALLRGGRFQDADIANIAEEIESMGRSERRELISRLQRVLTHLLKWQFQSDKRGHSWRYTIIEQRLAVHDHLQDNPSLKSQMADLIAQSYIRARLGAARDTGLLIETFPVECSWSLSDILSEDWWPDNFGTGRQ